MPSRKKWKYFGIGIVGGIFGSAVLAVGAIFLIALWPVSPTANSIVLSEIGCPGGMLENMTTSRCEMSDEMSASVSAEFQKLMEANSSDNPPNAQQIRKLAEKVSHNKTLKFKLYGIAAFLGDPVSQYEVGGMLSNGEGTEEDDLESLRWLHEAAHNDHLEAQIRLAHMLSSGTYVKRDKRLATKWLSRAEANKSLPKTAELGV